jgi:hypothetical protein
VPVFTASGPATARRYDRSAAVGGRGRFGQRPGGNFAVRKQPGDRASPTKSINCANRADALALVTEWHEFGRPSIERLKSLMKSPVVFDGRNVCEPTELRAAGFKYYGIGRGKDGQRAAELQPRSPSRPPSRNSGTRRRPETAAHSTSPGPRRIRVQFVATAPG